ncbi:uncharacterized protein LOC120647025 isoform X1 [Panicum virgatum]|uniref:Uncharacterized protein n=1 Tax=Panicum virgatum TaxID=38727 RepID=A0A8T0P1S5_PANVG|nr:uncharacterized protein LOC120647025 isoform X1 [Panicum virgatum]KAG2554152.1 hypothetical protein PVAP13_9KG644600 [Panicum virgatum]
MTKLDFYFFQLTSRPHLSFPQHPTHLSHSLLPYPAPPPACRPVAAALSAFARRLPRLPSSPGTTSGALLSPAETAPLALTAAAAAAAALAYSSSSTAALSYRSCLSCSATSRGPITDTSLATARRIMPTAGASLCRTAAPSGRSTTAHTSTPNSAATPRSWWSRSRRGTRRGSSPPSGSTPRLSLRRPCVLPTPHLLICFELTSAVLGAFANPEVEKIIFASCSCLNCLCISVQDLAVFEMLSEDAD